jgi:hypothetical protein
MSSPKAAKAAKSGKSTKVAKPAKADKAIGKSAASRSRAADGEVFAGEDKVNFVKAIWEGVPSKEAKTSGGSRSRVEETTKGKSGQDKPKGDKPKGDKPKGDKPKADKAPKVEILRKISAPVRVASRQTPESAQALALVAALEAKFDAGELDVLTPEATQALMGVICRIYSANQESGNKYSLLSGRAAVTGTDAMITCSSLLKAVDLQVFELGMWQSWSGI